MADKIGTDEYGEILIYQTDDGKSKSKTKLLSTRWNKINKNILTGKLRRGI